MFLVPLTLKEAYVWVDDVHRHHKAPQGGKFAIGVAEDYEGIIGVAISGRPVSRNLDDGWTIEVLRVAVKEGHPNACSKLYAASWRAARAMGYIRAITYTLDDEPGTSLVAAGWRLVAESKGGSWSRKDMP